MYFISVLMHLPFPSHIFTHSNIYLYPLSDPDIVLHCVEQGKVDSTVADRQIDR